MPAKLTSQEKKGLTKAERKIAVKKKRAVEHAKFIRGLIGNDAPETSTNLTATPSSKEGEQVKRVKPAKVERIYTNPDKIRRVQAAQKRLEETKDRTSQQQIQALDDRLGVGVGAVKERKKLLNKIEKKFTSQEIKKEIEKQTSVTVSQTSDVVVKPRLKAKERRAQEKKNSK